MEKIIALYDYDVFYATRFMEYFKKKQDFRFDVVAFTKNESLNEFLNNHSIEILLISDRIIMEDYLKEKIKYIYKLTEYPKINEDTQPVNVYKYQSAYTVIENVLTDYYQKANIIPACNGSEKVQLISIFSLIPKVEALAFAWSLSSILAAQNKVHLILLDLLPFPLIQVPDNNSLTEFIYNLKENPNIIMKLNSLSCHIGNISCLSGIEHGEDILSLSKADIQRWTQELRKNLGMPTVIFHLGGYTEAGMELMKLSDTIIISEATSAYEASLYKIWSQQMERSGFDRKSESLKSIQLREEKELGYNPITLAELANTDTWSNAVQFKNYYL